jgi:hypothetical protein
MGDTFKSGGGPMNIVKGHGKIINNNYPQIPIDDLLKLLKQAKEEAQHLPEPVRDKVRQEIKEAQLQVKETPQEKEKIAVKLNNAKDTLKAIAETVPQAVSVGNLLGNALIWLDKIL